MFSYYNMTIIGNITSDDKDYLKKLDNLIANYDLKNYIQIKTDVPFDELQKLLQRTNIYLHPTTAEPFGISIVEAMSAGLVAITPNVGGNTEFVPAKYQYQSIEHAAEIIAKIIKNKSKNTIAKERQNLAITAVSSTPKKEKRRLSKKQTKKGL